jgi:crooked neck
VQSYIDFEIGEGERERTRELYERLLQRTHHVKVWMSYADFEGAPMPEPEDDEEEDAEAAAARRAQAAQSGPESAASREARARRCPVTCNHLLHMLRSTYHAENASV